MKKGFTLIEVIGAVVILGLISLIAIPTLLNVIKNKEREMNEVTKQLVYTASSQYTTKYENIFKRTVGNDYCITVKDLVINNFLTEINTDDINLDTKVKITIDENKKYKYEIDNNCEPTQLETEQLAISVTNQTGVFNELDWAKEDFYVSIIGNGTSYKWCSTNEDNCTPDTIVNKSSGSSLIDTEGTNTICAMAISDTNESEVECNSFKLDKTKPDLILEKISDENSELVYTDTLSKLNSIDGTDLSTPQETYIVNYLNEELIGISKYVTIKDVAGNEANYYLHYEVTAVEGEWGEDWEIEYEPLEDVFNVLQLEVHCDGASFTDAEYDSSTGKISGACYYLEKGCTGGAVVCDPQGTGAYEECYCVEGGYQDYYSMSFPDSYLFVYGTIIIE